MNISGPNSPLSSSTQSLGIDDFRHSAQAGGDVQVQLDGASFKLIAAGETPSGRSVAWVDGSVDTTRMFLEALGNAYGGHLSHAVADELGLRPTPGAALSAETITQALKMAETAHNALDGALFAAQLGRLADPETGTDR